MSNPKSRNWQGINNRRWARLRLQVLRRDGYRCQAPGCGRAGALEVDHRLPLAAGGAMWDTSNLQSLCRSCHIAKTAVENGRAPRSEWDDYVEGIERAAQM